MWYSAAHLGDLERNRNGPRRDIIESMFVAALPADWCAKILALAPAEKRERWNHGGWFGYGVTRREAEDAAGGSGGEKPPTPPAFARLPPKRRAELLAEPPPAVPPKKGQRRK